jgi:hypothetical protein
MAHIRNTRYYAEKLAEQYPYLDKESIVQTCKQFMLELYSLVRTNHEILIESRGGRGRNPNLMLKIYRVQPDVQRNNYRALRGGSRRRRERQIRARRRVIRRHLKLGPAPDLFELNPK